MTAPRPVRVVRFAEGRDFSLGQLGLGIVSGVGAFLYVVALHGASGGFDSVLWSFVPFAALLLVVADSGFPLAYWGFMLALWVWHTEAGTFSAWSVLGAAGVVLSHASLTLSATMPLTAAVPRHAVARWAERAALALLPSALLAFGAGVIGSWDGAAGSLVTVAALVAVALGTAWLRSTPPEDTN